MKMVKTLEVDQRSQSEESEDIIEWSNGANTADKLGRMTGESTDKGNGKKPKKANKTTSDDGNKKSKKSGSRTTASLATPQKATKPSQGSEDEWIVQNKKTYKKSLNGKSGGAKKGKSVRSFDPRPCHA